MAPSVLVIAYDFPPHGAIGTMRTLRLVRQLHADGCDVTVLTGNPATYVSGTHVEPRLELLVPAGVRVLQVRALRPFNALEQMLRRFWVNESAVESTGGRDATPVVSKPEGSKRSSWMRPIVSARDLVEAVLDVPDKESGWIGPAVARGLMHVRRHGRPDVIYSSAPPWSGQAVALALATLCGRPWVADFRDPWARAPWRDWRRPFRQRLSTALERRVVHRADSVLFVTRANLAEFSEFYGPIVAPRFHLIPNGCDPSEFENVTPLPRREHFVLLHAGTLYGARTPLPVLRAVAAAIQRGALDRHRFRLRLLGNVSLAPDLTTECRRLGIEDVVECVPRVSRGESLREMKSASALLLIQIGTTVSIPGKAYEYLAAGRPMLGLSEEGETAALVRTSGLGVTVRPDESIERIEAALLEVVSLAARECPPVPRELFDGWTHAAVAARLVIERARLGRTTTAGVTLVESASGARPREESQP